MITIVSELLLKKDWHKKVLIDMFCVISLYKDRINGEITKKRARYNFKETKDEALKYMKK